MFDGVAGEDIDLDLDLSDQLGQESEFICLYEASVLIKLLQGKIISATSWKPQQLTTVTLAR